MSAEISVMQAKTAWKARTESRRISTFCCHAPVYDSRITDHQFELLEPDQTGNRDAALRKNWPTFAGREAISYAPGIVSARMSRRRYRPFFGLAETGVSNESGVASE